MSVTLSGRRRVDLPGDARCGGVLRRFVLRHGEAVHHASHVEPDSRELSGDQRERRAGRAAALLQERDGGDHERGGVRVGVSGRGDAQTNAGETVEVWRGGAAGLQSEPADGATVGSVDVPANRHCVRSGAGAVGEAVGDDSMGSGDEECCCVDRIEATAERSADHASMARSG